MRRAIIAGNHKMNLLPNESAKFISSLLNLIDASEKPEIILFPSYASIAKLLDKTQGTQISIGAQNIYYQDQGAYTGEVSADMVKDLGCEWVLCGHSERRDIFLDNDEQVNLKIKAAIKNDLKPMLCIGEHLNHRNNGETQDLLTSQLYGSLKGLSEESLKDLVIAYEPVWAIGTGKTATPEDAQSTINFIRNKLADIFSDKFSDNIRILYGGSVNPNNVKQLMGQKDIDGALIGGASLKADSFAKLVKYDD
ncbi:MAG: triose-phosphate isomerase [Clostridia bacterium]